MSWTDRYTQPMTIGISRLKNGQTETRSFDVKTLPAFTKEVEWNYTEYPFVNVNGVLGKKRKLLKREFEMDFYFVGDKNIETATEFEDWAMSEMPWTIIHPYYDTILCNVVKLKFDNTLLNATRISGTAIETIDENTIGFVSKDPYKFIKIKSEQIASVIENKIKDIDITVNDKDVLIADARTRFDTMSKVISSLEDATEYNNMFNEYITLLNDVTAGPILAMQALNTFITMPYVFVISVKEKMNVFLTEFDNLRRTISSLTNRSQKRVWEIKSVAEFQAMCLSSMNPLLTDYIKAVDALNVINQIKTAKAQFDADISAIQSPNGSNPDFYVPNYEMISAVDKIVSTTISNLYVIALSGKREFIQVLEKDSNVVLLAHRFYGPDAQDLNMKKLIDTNNLNYKQIALGIKKGTEIAYYK
jgi:hypothetical protein